MAEYVDDGGTVILSTHVLEVIEKVGDRFVVLKSGKVIADFTAFNPFGVGLEACIIELPRAPNDSV